MIVRIHNISVRSRPAAIALAAAALAGGAVFIAFGIVLLLGLAAIGSAVGAGVLLVRALTGRRGGRLHGAPHLELDPALEVFPIDQEAPTPLPPHKRTTPHLPDVRGHKPQKPD
jgi:hypothetical protein